MIDFLLLFAEPGYGTAYTLLILFVLLGACGVAVPRLRKVDPLARKKKKKKKKR